MFKKGGASTGDATESSSGGWPSLGDPHGAQSRHGGKCEDRTRPKEGAADTKTPELAHRRMHKKSTFVAGRTIGEKRERLETANERAAAREKDKRKNRTRIVTVTLVFIAFIAVLILLARAFFPKPPEEPIVTEPEPVVTADPTIEVVDESTPGGKITSRMKNYLGLLELDLKSYGLRPTKAVIPQGSIRQVNIYLDGYTGYLKATIDRGAGVTAEDADRMLRYLQGQGITDFEYIDLRLDGRAYWK